MTGRSRKPQVHGTSHSYVHWRCRCCDCRKANAAAKARQNLARLKRGPPEHVHGLLNGYNNYLCRCEPCIRAKADYWHDYTNGLT